MSEENKREPDEINAMQMDVMSGEDYEKRLQLRKLLESHFEETVLYKVYKENNMLDLLFTEKILSMDINKHYSTKEVAEICETETYNINNKRSEFVDYISPTMKTPNSKHWKHDYLAVFKLKMIDGLTGQNGMYTLKQIKIMLYGNKEDNESAKAPVMDSVNQLLAFQDKVFSSIGYDNAEQVFRNLSNPEIINTLLNINDKIQVIEEYERKLIDAPGNNLAEKVEELEKQLEEQGKEAKRLEESNKKMELVRKKCNEIFESINEPNKSLLEKEREMAKFNELMMEYPEHRDLIMLYQGYGQNKVNELKGVAEDEIKRRALTLYQKIEDESLDIDNINKVLDELEVIVREHPELQNELYVYLANAKTLQRSMRQSQQTTEKKKGFFSRLFGGK